MNAHTRTLLRCVYWAYVAKNFDRESHIEAWLEIENLDDLVTNESSVDDAAEYQALFLGAPFEELVREFQSLRFRLDGKPFEACELELSVLKFMQFVLGRAMWKFRLDIGPELERFTRDNDRLDLVDEQRRLHRECQLPPDAARPLN